VSPSFKSGTLATVRRAQELKTREAGALRSSCDDGAARLLQKTGMCLRGGGATSGIWDTFNRIKADGSNKLDEVIPQVFNEATIDIHRSNEGVDFALKCDARPFRGDTVGVVGVWSPTSTVGTPTQEVKVELELEKAETWKAHVNLPPGELKYRYALNKRGEDRVIENITRIALIYPKPQENSIMVSTDLDGTMLGNQEFIHTFFRVWEDEYKKNHSVLIYNTGRPLDSALGLITSGQLPQPDALICSEGTQIFWFGEPEKEGQVNVTPDEEWRHMLNTTWDWPKLKEAVKNTLDPFKGNVTKFLPLADMDALQPMIVIALDCQQSSVGVLQGLQGLSPEFRNTFDVIQSCSGTEWYILMVPAGAGKGTAALHVASRLGFAPEQIMVAGDGENDLPLFEITKLGARGVVVNNACARLKDWKATEGPWTVVVASNSNAGGVLEGLWRHFRHFGYTHRAADENFVAQIPAAPTSTSTAACPPPPPPQETALQEPSVSLWKFVFL
jgi:hydroxymethylpyrimidine pyrophosphatase-like HAD family hydrolase